MATTSQIRRVLAAFLADPTGEHAGLDLSARAGLPRGAIYPALAWLEEAGWISSRWRDPALAEPGRRRRYYRLTAAGVTAALATAAPAPKARWPWLLAAPAWPVTT